MDLPNLLNSVQMVYPRIYAHLVEDYDPRLFDSMFQLLDRRGHVTCSHNIDLVFDG